MRTLIADLQLTLKTMLKKSSMALRLIGLPVELDRKSSTKDISKTPIKRKRSSYKVQYLIYQTIPNMLQ